MWTPDTRSEHDREDLHDPSDLTDAEWAILDPVVPATGQDRPQTRLADA